MRKTGIYQKIGNLDYFIPHALPPITPPFTITTELMTLYGEASFALGQLNEMSLRLPDAHYFIKAYVIKEALLSSAIEGIHTTMIDVFASATQELKPNKDTQLVLNYTKALEVSLQMLQQEQLPLVSRIILKAHEALLSHGESDNKTPGHYRKLSVRVGQLIPPPAMEIPMLIEKLEKYMNEPSELPALIRVGLVHVQFETIHPFLDGNGRIGRLLIVLMLIHTGLLNLPILYPSYYFKSHHLSYYQKLNEVRTKGDFEGWIFYYLQAIKYSAQDAYRRAKEIENLELALREKITTDAAFFKMRDTSLEVLKFLFSQPITTIARVSDKLEKAYNTIANIFNHLVEANIVSENVTHKRNKVYRFKLYLDLLEKEYGV